MGNVVGAVFGGLALLFWYGLELTMRHRRQTAPSLSCDHVTPLTPRIESMLTEARVLLPGAQALFGFQMSILLTERFGELDAGQRIIHAVSLGSIALAIILLMAPAAFHRIAFGGENTEGFFRIGSRLVIASALPLALGISGDLYVAASLALSSPWWGLPLLSAASQSSFGFGSHGL